MTSKEILDWERMKIHIREGVTGRVELQRKWEGVTSLLVESDQERNTKQISFKLRKVERVQAIIIMR